MRRAERRAAIAAPIVLWVLSAGRAVGADRDGPALERMRPPLYIVSMMHAEEKLYFKEDEHKFRIHADNLRRLAKQFAGHGAKLAFQPDWTFIDGARQWDPSLFTDLLSQGMGVDAHAHGTKVRLEEVAERLQECGVPYVRVGNGDWSKVPAMRPPPNANPFWPFGLPWEGTGKPYFEALCAYKNPVGSANSSSQSLGESGPSADQHPRALHWAGHVVPSGFRPHLADPEDHRGREPFRQAIWLVALPVSSTRGKVAVPGADSGERVPAH